MSKTNITQENTTAPEENTTAPCQKSELDALLAEAMQYIEKYHPDSPLNERYKTLMK